MPSWTAQASALVFCWRMRRSIQYEDRFWRLALLGWRTSSEMEMAIPTSTQAWGTSASEARGRWMTGGWRWIWRTARGSWSAAAGWNRLCEPLRWWASGSGCGRAGRTHGWSASICIYRAVRCLWCTTTVTAAVVLLWAGEQRWTRSICWDRVCLKNLLKPDSEPAVVLIHPWCFTVILLHLLLKRNGT